MMSLSSAACPAAKPLGSLWFESSRQSIPAFSFFKSFDIVQQSIQSCLQSRLNRSLGFDECSGRPGVNHGGESLFSVPFEGRGESSHSDLQKSRNSSGSVIVSFGFRTVPTPVVSDATEQLPKRFFPVNLGVLFRLYTSGNVCADKELYLNASAIRRVVIGGAIRTNPRVSPRGFFEFRSMGQRLRPSDVPTGCQGQQLRSNWSRPTRSMHVSVPRRKCVPMLTWIVPAVSSIMQLGIFFAAAAALVAGMLRIR